ncbi:Lipoprotein-releasing system ATP-binding protein LolD [hydrothermal vent metagenome]|uniref:Lipoprotein-releasing system ATP-binding protein LolD n=1 Tax=hydrothermal vent metagenome TaxID=652676 RepID=A0A3B0YCE4_9ZZZZ
MNELVGLSKRQKTRFNKAKITSSDADLILSCEKLNKQFEDGNLKVQVLFNVDLQVKVGERIAIVGSSGSGKSTLLHLLGGLDIPTSGDVNVAGYNMNHLNESDRGLLRNFSLGFVYQFHHLMPEFTALENVAMPLLIRGINRSDAMSDAESILSKIGMEHRLNHKPGELSGGERQRAAIARSLVTKPGCMLADEPTGNLDRKNEQRIYEQLIELHQETQISFVIVTHDEVLAQRMDKVYQLEDGILSS